MSENQESDIKLYNKIYGDYINVESTAATVSNYTKLATDYESDFVGLGYETPQVVATSALEFMEDKDGKILDVACGTGLVAEKLRSIGFKGKIDGIDGSSGMLALAKSKEGLYDNLVEAFVNPGGELPFKTDFYDAIVCCGGYGPGHLMPVTLEQLLKVAKPGGVIVFATRDNEQATGYVVELDKAIKDLADRKLWIEKKVIKSTYFRFDKGKDTPLNALIYCCQKC